jgi:rhomboid family GlyGly-CTERM serine protease
VNLSLLTGQGAPVGRFAFLPGLVSAGEWWRVATHPLAHVSLYHLVLDAGAFLLLYQGFHGFSARRRLLLCAGAAAGSLVLAGLAPTFTRAGLCGLSGTAHGLMAASALVSVRASTLSERRVGWLLLTLVAGKALFEAVTGHVLFVSWHLGDVGSPNPFCHLGGVLGGLAALLPLRRRPMAAQRKTLARLRGFDLRSDYLRARARGANATPEVLKKPRDQLYSSVEKHEESNGIQSRDQRRA